MKIFVKAKPGAKKESVEKVDANNFIVSVKEPAKEGRANWAIERALARHFKVSPSQVRIISGQKSRQKVVEIDGSLPLNG